MFNYVINEPITVEEFRGPRIRRDPCLASILLGNPPARFGHFRWLRSGYVRGLIAGDPLSFRHTQYYRSVFLCQFLSKIGKQVGLTG